jgi:hypothetical protein
MYKVILKGYVKQKWLLIHLNFFKNVFGLRFFYDNIIINLKVVNLNTGTYSDDRYTSYEKTNECCW